MNRWAIASSAAFQSGSGAAKCVEIRPDDLLRTQSTYGTGNTTEVPSPFQLTNVTYNELLTPAFLDEGYAKNFARNSRTSEALYALRFLQIAKKFVTICQALRLLH